MADATGATTQDTLDARLQAWEREKEGIIKDNQREREARHRAEEKADSLAQKSASMEQRLAELETALSAGKPEPEVQSKVDLLAKDPDGYIKDVVTRLKPWEKDTQALKLERQWDKAYGWLAKQLKKDVDDIYGSSEEKEIARIMRDHGLGALPPPESAKAAFKIYQQELSEKEKDEANRTQSIQGNSGERVSSPTPGTRRFTRQEIMKMDLDEYSKNEEAIKEAAKAGLID